MNNPEETNDLRELPELLPENFEAGISDRTLQKHPGLDDLFLKALRGELPRSRALKSWEPATINETHLQVILLRAGGMRQRDIAGFLNFRLGTKLSDAAVSIICNHPDAQYILSKIVSYAADNVTDVSARIAAYAGEALDKNVQLMRTTNDDKLAARIGFDFLDRAGYGAAQRHKLEVEATHKVVMAPNVAQNLTDALREVQAAKEIPINFVMTGLQHVQGEGSGNALVGSESAEDSGPVLASVPPTRASLQPKPLRADPLVEKDEVDDEKVLRSQPPIRKVG